MLEEDLIRLKLLDCELGVELLLLLLRRSVKPDLWRKDILQLSFTPLINVIGVKELLINVGAYAIDNCVWLNCSD